MANLCGLCLLARIFTKYEIPRFMHTQFNWGDIVRAPVDSDQIPQVQEVVRRSGHETFRVLFNPELDQNTQDSILSSLQTLELSWEVCDDRFVAIDVHPSANYDAVYDKLCELQKVEYLGLKPVKHACRVGLTRDHSMATKSPRITPRAPAPRGLVSYDAALLLALFS